MKEYEESRPAGGTVMWDTVDTNETHLSHELPCPRCGHEAHTFFPCDGCDCQPAPMPGAALTR